MMLSHNQLPIPPAPTPLAFLQEAHANHAASLLLLTGASGVGKTTWCQALYTFACRQNWTVCGLISPPVMADGRKIAIDLRDLRTGQRRRLATRITPPPAGHHLSHSPKAASDRPPQKSRASITTGQWRFNPCTLHWGNTILSHARAKSKTPQPEYADLLIIDELGPLEFRRQQGLQAAMKLIDAWRSNLICVTIRPSLIGAARMRWPWARILQIQDTDAPPNDTI